MQGNEKQLVIKAIGDLGRRVTTADVATKTGLPVLVVQQKLNEVATDVGGHMQVGTAGDIVYSFSPGFSNTYLAKGIKAAFLLVFAKLLQAAFFLFRISFGIMLVLSLLIVILLIIGMTFIMIKGTNTDRRRDGEESGFALNPFGGGFHFTFWDWMVLRDLFQWNSYRSYQPVVYQYNQPTVRKRAKSSFLLNCFSFLFGDGDPNEGLQEKKWQLIAQVIKRNKNVVTAEQLAPYTGADPKDEDAVLPVLVRFNGRPEVTDKGNIVYVFESLQPVAVHQRVNPPEYLQEFNWKFTNVPDGEMLPVWILAGLNGFGAWTVWNFFRHISLERVVDDGLTLAQWHNFQMFLSVLLAYGVLFIAIPIGRAIVNFVRNKKIDARNIQRFRYAQLVAHPSAELTQKLAEARAFRVADRKITQADVVYTTEKDALDQEDELSEKFKEMSFEPEKSLTTDDIRKKLQRDFDASP